jgi:hypothetical protein
MTRNVDFACYLKVSKAGDNQVVAEISLPKRGVRRADIVEDRKQDYFVTHSGLVHRLGKSFIAVRDNGTRKSFVFDYMTFWNVFREACFWSASASETLDTSFGVDWNDVATHVMGKQ